MRTILLATTLLAMITLAPMAAAVHGSAYTAHGLATRNGATYDAIVKWTGYWNLEGLPPQSYLVQLSDTSTGDLVADSGAFPGQWASNCWCYSGTEFFFPYHGWANAGSELFDIRGLQTIQINTGNQFMVYVGNYLDYNLVLLVDDYAG
ncbi:MAG TPA: hypothetical protein VGR28_15165 [Candidatus Thermoplasmatota archaeon]|jgi:hypothetical protein|nr:hypothetical protein [Candidatus Thermoplasmatota archaeon]